MMLPPFRRQIAQKPLSGRTVMSPLLLIDSLTTPRSQSVLSPTWNTTYRKCFFPSMFHVKLRLLLILFLNVQSRFSAGSYLYYPITSPSAKALFAKNSSTGVKAKVIVMHADSLLLATQADLRETLHINKTPTTKYLCDL